MSGKNKNRSPNQRYRFIQKRTMLQAPVCFLIVLYHRSPYPCLQNVMKSTHIYQISTELVPSQHFFFYFIFFSSNQFSVNHAKATFLNTFIELFLRQSQFVFRYLISINQSICVPICFYVNFINIKCIVTFPLHIHLRSTVVFT